MMYDVLRSKYYVYIIPAASRSDIASTSDIDIFLLLVLLRVPRISSHQEFHCCIIGETDEKNPYETDRSGV